MKTYLTISTSSKGVVISVANRGVTVSKKLTQAEIKGLVRTLAPMIK